VDDTVSARLCPPYGATTTAARNAWPLTHPAWRLGSRHTTMVDGEERMKSTVAAVAAVALVVSAFVAPATAEPITLQLNSPAPPWSYVDKEVLTPWAEAITADSGGTLKVQTFYGGTLGTFANTYDRVSTRWSTSGSSSRRAPPEKSGSRTWRRCRSRPRTR